MPIDAAFLADAPALRIVAMQSVGYDNVDVPRLRERGIVLTNSRGSLVEAVADLTYGLVIIAVRQLGPAIAWARDGRWLAHGDPPYSHDLEGATLGVVGFGAIGVALARRAHASKMNVIYHTRTPRADDAQTGGSYRTFDALLAEADCVVALLPLTPQTRGMFGDAAFARMKPSATFVNAARGPICDTNALLRALEQKKIAGAVLDVTDPEPLPPGAPALRARGRRDHPARRQRDGGDAHAHGDARRAEPARVRRRRAAAHARRLTPSPAAERARERDGEPAAERAARNVERIREQSLVRAARFLRDFDDGRERRDDERRAQRGPARARQRAIHDEADQRERDDAVELAQHDVQRERPFAGVFAEDAVDQADGQRLPVDAMADRGEEHDRDGDGREAAQARRLNRRRRSRQGSRNTNSVSD